MDGATSESVTKLQQKPVEKAPPDLDNPANYVNRELGLLTFQWRVLEEAQDSSNPLLERVKFLAIVGSNLDEFFMVRVASLTAQVDAGIAGSRPGPHESHARNWWPSAEKSNASIDAAHDCLERQLMPALAEEPAFAF